MNTDKHGFNRRRQRERRGGKRQNHKEDCKFETRNFKDFKAEDLRSLTKLLRIVVRMNTNAMKMFNMRERRGGGPGRAGQPSGTGQAQAHFWVSGFTLEFWMLHGKPTKTPGQKDLAEVAPSQVSN
jgi:hypothetical protein